MQHDLYTILRILTVFQFLFFSIFLFFHKTGKRNSNKFFAIFLLSKALCYFSSLAYSYRDVFNVGYPYTIFIGMTFEFLIGPSLFFYVKSLLYHDFKLKKSHLLHLIFFFFYLLFIIITFLFDNAEIYQYVFHNLTILSERKFFYTLVYIHFLIYCIWSISLVRQYRLEVKRTFANIENIYYSWVYLLSIGFCVLWFISFAHFLATLFGYTLYFKSTYFIIGIFIFSNVIVFKGLKQPDIFNGLSEKSLKKNKTALLSKLDMDNYLTRIQVFMETRKPFLSPFFKIHDLSEHIKIPVSHISYTLNKGIGMNFYQFVNQYRIEESKRILAEKKSKKKTVLEVIYETGFNSKSTFNSFFKKYTGITPTEYIRNCNQ